MPGNEGLNGLAEVHALYPDVLVVVITAQEEPMLWQNRLR